MTSYELENINLYFTDHKVMYLYNRQDPKS